MPIPPEVAGYVEPGSFQLLDKEVRGRVDTILRQLRRRFGEAPAELRQRIEGLPSAQLEALAEALLDFSNLADAEAWVGAHG